MLGIQCIDQRLSSTRPAAGAVDDARAFLFSANRAASMMFWLLVSGVWQRDEIGALEQFVEFDLLDAYPWALRRQERGRMRSPSWPQAETTVGDDGDDIAAAYHAQGLGGDLDAHEAVSPTCRPGRGVAGGIHAPAPASA